jgi:hypothetical protein
MLSKNSLQKTTFAMSFEYIQVSLMSMSSKALAWTPSQQLFAPCPARGPSFLFEYSVQLVGQASLVLIEHSAAVSFKAAAGVVHILTIHIDHLFADQAGPEGESPNGLEWDYCRVYHNSTHLLVTAFPASLRVWCGRWRSPGSFYLSRLVQGCG